MHGISTHHASAAGTVVRSPRGSHRPGVDLDEPLHGTSPESLDADPTSADEATSTVTDLAGPDLDTPGAPSAKDRTRRVRALLGVLGPGVVTGVADEDPSCVATYSQAGAALGMGLLWTAPLSLPLRYGVQEICDRTR